MLCSCVSETEKGGPRLSHISAHRYKQKRRSKTGPREFKSPHSILLAKTLLTASANQESKESDTLQSTVQFTKLMDASLTVRMEAAMRAKQQVIKEVLQGKGPDGILS